LHPPWHIQIKSTVNDEFWKIDVIDNGKGFSQDIISKINRKIAEVGDKTGIPDFELDGIGLFNVFLRWKLHCGDKIIFSVGNSENRGGFVSIGRYFDSH